MASIASAGASPTPSPWARASTASERSAVRPAPATVAVPPAGAGWYNSNPNNLQGFTDAEGRFVILPTGDQDTLNFSASISFAGCPGGETQQESAAVAIDWPISACPADFDGDGDVDGGDIGIMLLAWGPCL